MDEAAKSPPGDDIAALITPLGHDVFEIDTLMGGYRGITAGYLIRGDRPVLVETGTALSTPVVVAALDHLGVGAQDLGAVVVTHIHLDHAGGVGDVAAAFPEAEVVVHARGARHLADPTRLMSSARMVFGDAMDSLFGPLLPVPEERLDVVEQHGWIDLGGGRRLEAFHSPGHASHHLGLIDTVSGDLYTGDAAGIYVPETADVRPATPPPDFDLGLALASLATFRDAAPTRLLFSHYGPVDDVDDVLARSEDELRLWVRVVAEAREGGADVDHAVALVSDRMATHQPRYYDNAAVTEKFEALSSTRANVQGIMRWLDRDTTT